MNLTIGYLSFVVVAAFASVQTKGPSKRIISSGENLTLTCEGNSDERLMWVHDDEMTTYQHRSRMPPNIFQSIGNDSFPRKLIFNLVNASYLDTGIYLCKEDNTKIAWPWHWYNSEVLLDLQLNPWVYVYVEDLNHVLAVKEEVTPIIPSFKEYGGLYDGSLFLATPTPESNAYLMSSLISNYDLAPYQKPFFGKYFIVPCKATSPDVALSLTWGDSSEEIENVDKFGYMNVSISESFVNKLEKFGPYMHCNAHRDNITNELKIFPLRIIDDSPMIETSTIHHVILGESLHIHCLIFGVHVLEWTSFPSQNDYEEIKSYDPWRRHQVINKQYMPMVDENNYYTISSLLITNVTKADEGFYECSTNDSTEYQKSDIQFLKVYPNNDPFVNLTTDKQVIFVDARNQKFANWTVKLIAFPNAWLIWGNSEENFHHSNGNKQQKYQIRTIDLYTRSLILNNITTLDRRNHTVTAANRYKRSTLNLELLVLDKPEPKFKSSKELYQIKTPTNVTCEVDSYPLLNRSVEWKFRRCYYYVGFCTNFFLVSNETGQISEEYIGPFLKRSTLQWKMEEPGELACVATNRFGERNATKRILVTDVPDEVKLIRQPSGEIVQGDNLTLTCAVNSYTYRNLPTWHRLSKKEVNLTDWSIVDRINYSNHSILKIINITNQQADLYFCRTMTIDGVEKKYFIEVKVQGYEFPYAERRIWSESDIIAALGKQIELTCPGTGKEILWFFSNDKKLIELPDDRLNVRFLGPNKNILRIENVTLEHVGNFSCFVHPDGEDKIYLTSIIALSVISSVFIFIIFHFAMLTQKMKKKIKAERLRFEQGKPEAIDNDLPIEEQTDLLPYDITFEFSAKKLIYIKHLGAGNFGVVFKAEAIGIVKYQEKTFVAVKKAHKDGLEALKSELKIMIHLGKHLNIVNLLGACTRYLHKNELLVIMEYCTYGNIRQYLSDHRNNFVNQNSAQEIDISHLLSTGCPSTCSNSSFISDSNSDESMIFNAGCRGYLQPSKIFPGWSTNIKGEYMKNYVEENRVWRIHATIKNIPRMVKQP